VTTKFYVVWVVSNCFFLLSLGLVYTSAREILNDGHHGVSSSPSSSSTSPAAGIKHDEQNHLNHRELAAAAAARLVDSRTSTRGSANYVMSSTWRTPLCSKADISITQGKSGDSNGIPAFSVQIVNLCVNHNCQLKNIHVACEAFASARPLDSRVFQRIKYNDCLVMGGAPLRAGGSVAFEYANSSEYPMHVISADLGPCS
jgi:hypothetical protein